MNADIHEKLEYAKTVFKWTAKSTPELKKTVMEFLKQEAIWNDDPEVRDQAFDLLSKHGGLT